MGVGRRRWLDELLSEHQTASMRRMRGPQGYWRWRCKCGATEDSVYEPGAKVWWLTERALKQHLDVVVGGA